MKPGEQDDQGEYINVTPVKKEKGNAGRVESEVAGIGTGTMKSVWDQQV